MSDLLEGWVHLRTVSLTSPAPATLNGRLVSFAVEAVGLTAEQAVSAIGRERASQELLDTLLLQSKGRYQPIRGCHGVISEPGFKGGEFLGAGRAFFREERRRLETALYAAESAGVGYDYLEFLKGSLECFKDLLTGSTFPDAFVKDCAGQRWLAMELKVANENASITTVLQDRRERSGVWDNELSLGQEIWSRAGALPQVWDGTDEEEWPVVQVLVIDALNAHWELGDSHPEVLDPFLCQLAAEVKGALTSGAYAGCEETVAPLKEVYFFTGSRTAPQLSRGFPLFPERV